MTRSTFLYATGGFFVGSAVTMAVMKYSRAQRSKKTELSEPTAESQDLLKTSVLLQPAGTTKVSFLTDLIAELWEYINVAGSNMMKEMMEPMLVEMTPAVNIVKIDLGKVPIQFDNIVVHKIQDGIVKMDMDVVWDGDCNVQLKANYVGSFGVKSFKLKGRMSFLMSPLTNELPVVSAIQYAFINPPSLKLDFTGLAQVADFKVIHNAVRNILQDTLQSMIVLPNRMLYKMMNSNDFLETYKAPLGIARFSMVRGRGFQVERKTLRGRDIPDVYCNVTLGASNMWRTSTIKNSLSPEWNESCDFLLSDYEQLICIQAMNEDSGALDYDDDLGTANISVGELLLAGRTMEIELVESITGYGSGAFVTFHCDVLKLTPSLKSFDDEKGAYALPGLLVIVVTQAFDIPLERNKAACSVKVSFAGNEFLTSAVTDYPGIDALNPQYNCAFHVPLTPELANGNAGVELTLMNGEDVLGTTSVTKASLVKAPDRVITEKRRIGDKGASLEFRVALRGTHHGRDKADHKGDVGRVASPSENVPSKSGSQEPIGVTMPVEEAPVGTVRLTVIKARGFTVQKRRFQKDDIPDVYCSISFEGYTLWTTSTSRNNITPNWNESKEFPLLNHHESVTIKVFDEDKRSTDELLGSVTITVSRLLLSGAATELALLKNDIETGTFVTIRCDMVDQDNMK